MTSGKGGSKTKKDIEQQLRGAQCLACLLSFRWSENSGKSRDSSKKEDYKSRFISVRKYRDIKTNQQRPEPKSISRDDHSTPNNMLKINAPKSISAIQKTGRKILIHHSNRDVRTWSYNCISIDTELALSSCRVS